MTRRNDFRVLPIIVVSVLEFVAWISTARGKNEKREKDECFHGLTVPRNATADKMIVYPA